MGALCDCFVHLVDSLHWWLPACRENTTDDETDAAHFGVLRNTLRCNPSDNLHGVKCKLQDYLGINKNEQISALFQT